MTYALYRINWVESERGWGQRDCGSSLHLTEEDANKEIKENWDKYPDSYVPDCYIGPSNNSPFLVDVDRETYNKVKFSKIFR